MFFWDDIYILSLSNNVTSFISFLFLYITLSAILGFCVAVIFAIRTCFHISVIRFLHSIFTIPIVFTSLLFVKDIIVWIIIAIFDTFEYSLFWKYIILTNFTVLLLPCIYSAFCKRKNIFLIIDGMIYFMTSLLLFELNKKEQYNLGVIFRKIVAGIFMTIIGVSILYLQLMLMNLIYKPLLKIEEKQPLIEIIDNDTNEINNEI